MSDYHHQLATIMFTDIVGYTALMGRDEEKGLNLLRKNREIHKPLIEKYEGHWIKEMGDGMMARFDSAYNATLCAIEIQQTAKKDFKGRLRIGLHLGEIAIEGGDIFGDDVNIASRIESLADPGGIYISEPIQKALQSHADIHTNYIGPGELKNVQSQVKIYNLVGHGLTTPSSRKIKQLRLNQDGARNKRKPILFILLVFLAVSLFAVNYWLGNRTERIVKAIAVLPFANFTGSDDEQYFVDMMHDAVIGELSKIGNIIVKSRTSTLQFRDTKLTIPEIARILNVDAIIESSVFKTGDSVYMQVQLIRARPVEDHIWSKDYERGTKYILSLYGDIAKAVAKEVEIQLTPFEEKRLTKKKEVSPEAYKAYLMGMYHWTKLTKEDLDLAEKYYQKAIEIDSNYAEAYLALEGVGAAREIIGLMSGEEARLRYEKYGKKAFELDSGLLNPQYKFAGRTFWGEWDFKEGLKQFETAIKFAPNDPGTRAWFAQALCIALNDYDRAIKEGEIATQIDPINNLWKGLYGQTLNYCRKYDEAEKIFTEVLDSDPYNSIALSNIKTTYHMQKKYTQAFEVWKIDNRKDSLAVKALEAGYKTGGYSEAMNAFAEYSIQKSRTEFVAPWRIFTLYTRAGMKAEALDWMEKAYEIHDMNMPAINTDPIFDYLRDDPRFQVIVTKMNFPK